MMLCGGPSYPASSKPEDVLAAMRHNQMEYFFSDVLLRGSYPGYALHFFEERGIDIGVQAVIAKSFARIHKENLFNYGILPLVFKSPTDLDLLEQDDVLEIETSGKALNQVSSR